LDNRIKEDSEALNKFLSRLLEAKLNSEGLS